MIYSQSGVAAVLGEKQSTGGQAGIITTGTEVVGEWGGSRSHMDSSAQVSGEASVEQMLLNCPK